MLRRGYGYLLAPANEQHLPDSVVTLRRLDQLLMNLLFRHLDCPWKKEAAVAGAANVVALFSNINTRLGDDEQSLCDRQLEWLDVPVKIPVGPCSEPMAQYIKMLLAVWEHQLELHRKLQVNTATRFLLRLMNRPPVATGRALQEALGNFHRRIRQQVRMSDHSPDAIRALLEQAAAGLENASFDGILLPHGTKKPPGGDGAAYWGQASGTSRNASAGSVDRRRCHQCGKEGHLREACPDSQPTCHGCGKVGHIRPQCPDRQRQQSGSGTAPEQERGRSTSHKKPGLTCPGRVGAEKKKVTVGMSRPRNINECITSIDKTNRVSHGGTATRLAGRVSLLTEVIVCYGGGVAVVHPATADVYYEKRRRSGSCYWRDFVGA
jgi:hypothetical protein